MTNTSESPKKWLIFARGEPAIDWVIGGVSFVLGFAALIAGIMAMVAAYG